MLTLSQIVQYVNANNIDDNTDIFSILSQMQLEHKETKPLRVAKEASHTPPASKTEYSTQDLLDLFNS